MAAVLGPVAGTRYILGNRAEAASLGRQLGSNVRRERQDIRMAKFTVIVVYRQFYVFDEEASPPYPEDIPDRDISNGLKAPPSLLAIYPENDGAVTVDVVVDPKPLTDVGAEWNHVVEAQINVLSGRIEVASPTDFLPECPRVEVQPGLYVAQVVSKRGDSEGTDCFIVRLSPGVCGPVRVILGAVDASA